jgi:hypothetical protein
MRRPVQLRSQLGDNLPQRSRFDQGVCGGDVLNGETLVVEEGPELSCFGERCCLGEYLAVVRSTFAGDQGEQGKYSGVGGSAKGERGE